MGSYDTRGYATSNKEDNPRWDSGATDEVFGPPPLQGRGRDSGWTILEHASETEMEVHLRILAHNFHNKLQHHFKMSEKFNLKCRATCQ